MLLHLALVNVSERLALERIVSDAGLLSSPVEDLAALMAGLRVHELRLAQYLRGPAPAAAAASAEPARPAQWDADGLSAAGIGAELVHNARLAIEATLFRWAPTADFRTATPEDTARARSNNPWIATTAVAVRAAGLWLDVTIYGAEPHPVRPLDAANGTWEIDGGKLKCVLTMLARCAASVAQERVSGPIDVLPNCIHRRAVGEVHPLAEPSPGGTSRFVLTLRGESMVVDVGAPQAARRRRRIADLRPGDVLLDDLPGLKPSDPPLLGRGTVVDSRRLDLLRTLPASVAESREVGVLVPSERYLTQLV